jgi:hypothetical protein
LAISVPSTATATAGDAVSLGAGGSAACATVGAGSAGALLVPSIAMSALGDTASARLLKESHPAIPTIPRATTAIAATSRARVELPPTG